MCDAFLGKGESYILVSKLNFNLEKVECVIR